MKRQNRKLYLERGLRKPRSLVRRVLVTSVSILRGSLVCQSGKGNFEDHVEQAKQEEELGGLLEYSLGLLVP